jgi:predicted SAM-dependent methyltransferase
MQEYLNTHSVKKLQLGAGGNVLSGWLNTDIEPHKPEVYQLDATSGFPFADNTFDYIFSEHMIEHMTYQEGRQMLQECFRVLKPSGRIRITCPDIDFLIKLYKSPGAMETSYVNWASAQLNWAPYTDAVFVINNYVRDWGHKFIYSRDVLAKTLDSVGFKQLEAFKITESKDENLRNLEIPQRMPPHFLQLESMTVEGVKQ